MTYLSSLSIKLVIDYDVTHFSYGWLYVLFLIFFLLFFNFFLCSSIKIISSSPFLIKKKKMFRVEYLRLTFKLRTVNPLLPLLFFLIKI